MLRWVMSSASRCAAATTTTTTAATTAWSGLSTHGVSCRRESTSSTPTRPRRRKSAHRKSLPSHRPGSSPHSASTASSFASAAKSHRHADSRARRPRSLDIAEEEQRVDVERHFPTAISFLRQPSRSTHATDEKQKRQWHDITHDVNVDGAPVAHHLSDDDPQRSFFDEGGLDIRGGLRDRARQAGVDLPSRAETLSPDILHLTGASPSLHGLAVAETSNAAPADETIEGDPSEKAFGDTPVELTDMLRERLMELKAERISEERNETFLPRRLHLASDAALQRAAPTRARTTRGRLTSARTETALLAHAQRAEQAERGSADTGASSQRTLADLDSPEAAAAPRVTAVARDGYDVSAALPVAQSASAYSPGGLYGDAMDTLLSLGGATAALGASPSDSAKESEGCVYLLRMLPRAGFCSRREAVVVIASGQVTVGGVVERNPFRLVRAGEDVHVAGHQSRLRVAPPRLWMYHKPANVVVSRNDPAGRRLITRHANILGFDHLIPVGSLPMRSHGALLLTNDGELSRYLENPRTMIQQTYLLRVRPAIDPSLAQKLNEDGVNINGRQYHQAEFLVNPAMKSRFSVKVKVRGETMPIAHLMQHLGRIIERGGRISFGPFSLGTLAVGSVREVTVPPHYMEHLGTLWKPFIERDWPFFRRQRVSRLRRLCRYRELTPKELEELDNFTYEEVQDALSLEEQELSAAAEARAALDTRTSLKAPLPSDVALPTDFPSFADDDSRHALLGYHNTRQEDIIVEDITRLR